MKQFIFCFLFLAFQNTFHAQAQRTLEVAVKPLEFALLNFEMNVAIGNERARYGVYFGYRPGTQESGAVTTVGHGAYGGYGSSNAFNRMYDSYTIGLYQKTYLLKKQKIYAELDVYYRNWSFKDKHASFENVEGYSFDGIRTEHIDVYGLKLVGGKTIYLTRKDKKIKPYIDVYVGLCFRHQEHTYETQDGTVNDTYYIYKKDHFSYNYPTPQAGLKLGFMITK
jgi:hypothetical protein